ncbi:MAG: 23S rRNA (adenine(2503)-C(2))-methyltransferase RlmN [Syntrophobacteraceae bacterium]
MKPVLIKNLSPPELESWVQTLGERPFRARQLFRHLYVRNISSWDECTDLSRSFRNQLEFGTQLDALAISRVDEAHDGTRKYLFGLHDGNHIESVLIPDESRCTLCVSSQVGCALGCRFCLTGAMGFKRNLDTAEIVDQVCQVQRDAGQRFKITSLVFMGMGEPLANYDAVLRAMRIITDQNGLAFSHRRVTLSTVGILPRLRQLGQDSPVNLAVSLHAPDDALRNDLMPVNRTYPLADLMRACREYPLPPRKRITFEYILLDGVNDSPEQARELVRILHGVRAKVNLLPFNPHPDSDFRTPSEEKVLAFQEVLQKAQLTAIIRKSRGGEIGAACGQLAARAGAIESAMNLQDH